MTQWERGVLEFNRQRWWEAHEGWEEGWKGLPQPAKRRVQALIQAVACFHLLEIGREEPALRLARAAVAKLAEDADAPVEIPGVERVLEAILKTRDGWMEKASRLRARVTQ